MTDAVQYGADTALRTDAVTMLRLHPASIRRDRLLISAAVVALTVTALSADALARVKQRYVHAYTTQINMIERTSDGAVSTTNADWNATEGFVPACREDYPDPKRRPSYVASVTSFESTIPAIAKTIGASAKNTKRLLEADPTKFKKWFTRPVADGKVISRGARILYVALSQEDVFALGHIQTALGKLAVGECDIGTPMDEAHTLIASAHVDVGKALKILRSLLP